jgi:hypothetical protein
MNIIEALTAAKEHGKDVRPLSWRPRGEFDHLMRFVRWHDGLGEGWYIHYGPDSGYAKYTDFAHFYKPDELLGGWEELK